MKTSTAAITIAIFFGSALPGSATAVLSLNPSSGALSGLAGSTVGWGFTLSNATNFAVVTSSNFCLGASGATIACLAPTTGAYSDQIATNYTIAGPAPEAPTITQAFNATAGSGIGSFVISKGASVGTTDAGQIVVSYDVYSVDPMASNFDPTADLVSAGNFLSDPASISVTSAVPEIDANSGASAIALLVGVLLILRRRQTGVEMCDWS